MLRALLAADTVSELSEGMFLRIQLNYITFLHFRSQHFQILEEEPITNDLAMYFATLLFR